MNENKTGNFIKNLRTENNLTQDDLAVKIPISRQAISKWEKGKSSPAPDVLNKLSEIFNVSINELLAGERIKSIEQNNNTQLLIYKQNSKLKRRIMLVSLFLILISSIFVYYFITTYNKIKVYTINASYDEINITSGVLVKTTKKIYFNIGEINSKIDINDLELYYIGKDSKKHIIYSCKNCDSLFISLIDYKGYNAYFEFSKLDFIINNMYLTINEKTDNLNIKLKIKEDFSNNDFFQNKDIPNTQENIINIEIRNDYEKLINQITKKYKKENDGYIYKQKNKQNEIEIIFLDNTINLELKTKNKNENWILNTLSNSINYTDNEKLDFIYDKRNDICLDGDCKNKQEIIEKFYKIIEQSLSK